MAVFYQKKYVKITNPKSKFPIISNGEQIKVRRLVAFGIRKHRKYCAANHTCQFHTELEKIKTYTSVFNRRTTGKMKT